ncbi:MAG: twin transmembrane helix small protein [Oleiphilus sp.]|nr:MAG: twin transmembrane helix small protein [Oleiphilus sp.]
MLKAILGILLLGVVISLFSGLFFLVKDQGKTKRVANSLAVRVTLAATIVIVIIVASLTGNLDFNPSPIPGF